MTVNVERGWPRITVVIPSFNQGRFLDAAIRSVLQQDYPNVELLVMDGGSTDGSIETIRRYEQSLKYWRSERDAGQAAAIREGFERGTGEILCWLNSDDLLLPGTLATVARLMRHHRRVDVIYGNRVVIDTDGQALTRHLWPWLITSAHWAEGQPVAQECCFWRRAIYDKVGGVDPSKYFTMDHDLFFRMWKIGRFHKTTAFLGCFRMHEDSKNAQSQDVREREMEVARQRYGLSRPGRIYRAILGRLDTLQRRVETWMLRMRHQDDVRAVVVLR